MKLDHILPWKIILLPFILFIIAFITKDQYFHFRIIFLMLNLNFLNQIFIFHFIVNLKICKNETATKI